MQKPCCITSPFQLMQQEVKHSHSGEQNTVAYSQVCFLWNLEDSIQYNNEMKHFTLISRIIYANPKPQNPLLEPPPRCNDPLPLEMAFSLQLITRKLIYETKVV